MTDVQDRSFATGLPPAPTIGRSSVASHARRAVPIRWLLGALLIGAAIAHVAARSHFAESTLLGATSVGSASLDIGLAGAVVVYPIRTVLRVTALTSLAVIALWAISRTQSLPVGPGASHVGMTFIDGVTVALQAIAAVLAAILVVRPSKGNTARPRMFIAVFGALAVTTAAIALPAARDHADVSHGAVAVNAATGSHIAPSGHHIQAGKAQDIGTGSPSDDPIDPATRAALQQQLIEARAFAMRYPTVSDATRAGYQLGGGLVPRKGATYISSSGLTAPGAFDPNRPQSLVYDGISPTSQVIGLVYFAVADRPPEGFAGPNDHWQGHTNVCIKAGPGGVGVLFPSDADVTAAQCSSVQGTLFRITHWTLHAWVVPSWESPLGVFSPENPDVRCADGMYNTDQAGYCRGT